MHSSSRLFSFHLLAAVYHDTLVMGYDALRSFLLWAGIFSATDQIVLPDTSTGRYEDGMVLNSAGKRRAFSTAIWIPATAADRTKEKSR